MRTTNFVRPGMITVNIKTMRHILAAILHLLVFSTVLVVYLNSSGDFSFLENGYYSIKDVNGVPTAYRDAVISHKVFVILLILFPVITAFFHIRRHFADPTNSVFWRFLEYSCTSTMMIYNIASLSGVLSTNELVSILVTNACIMILGYSIHRNLQKRDLRTASICTAVAWTLMALVFMPIGRAFYDRINALEKGGADGLPDRKFFDAVFWSMVTFFASFGAVQLAELLAHMYTSLPSNEIQQRADVGYDVLSFVSKSTLVGLVAGGLFGRAQDTR